MTFDDTAALYAYLVRIWKDSSLQMKRLCDANGIAYAHFLQPNQYVPDSKPMSAAERKVAIADGDYAKGATQGYPALRQQGEELRRAGVNFHDLTMAFKDVEEGMYNDNCCHLTPAGYRVIARMIGDRLGQDGSGSPLQPAAPPARSD
jgi:hypothetical protein